MAHKIPGKLRLARLRSGLSAETAAKRVGIARSTLTHYETGLRTPQPAVVARLAAIYRKRVAGV